MAASLMLKGTDGKIAGYVIQLENSLCFSVKGQGECGKLILMMDDGSEEEMEICCDAQERKAERLFREIAGAAVMIEETIYAFSGKKAKDALESRAQSKTAAKSQKDSYEKPEETRKKESSQCVYHRGDLSQGETDVLRRAHLRWPPPPCWPCARYVGGVWLDEGEE